MSQTQDSLKKNSILQLEKKYFLVEKISRGCFSDIWKAVDVDGIDVGANDVIQEITDIVKTDMDASDFVAIKSFKIIPNQKYVEERKSIDLSEVDVLFQFRCVFCIRILILMARARVFCNR